MVDMLASTRSEILKAFAKKNCSTATVPATLGVSYLHFRVSCKCFERDKTIATTWLCLKNGVCLLFKWPKHEEDGSGKCSTHHKLPTRTSKPFSWPTAHSPITSESDLPHTSLSSHSLILSMASTHLFRCSGVEWSLWERYRPKVI